jgi:hypothetical protein
MATTVASASAARQTYNNEGQMMASWWQDGGQMVASWWQDGGKIQGRWWQHEDNY